MSCRSTHRAAWLALAALAGCATVDETSLLRVPIAAREAGPGAAGVDGRAAFREAFCRRALQSGLPSADACDDLLWRLDDEPPAATVAREGSGTVPSGYRIFLVTGALGDCDMHDLKPFGDEIERLASAGTMVTPIRVGGRSSTTHNARQIADAIRSAGSGAGEPIILLGYSKGAVDILQFLVDEPALAAQVAAVVSVAGPIYGSPLADTAAWWYDHLLQRAFAGTCDPGDGGVIDSLRPAERTAWMAAHPLPSHVTYFSIAAFTTGSHVSRGLKLGWELLGGTGQRNDGQVIATDAVIPGSVLLGFVNADHWDVALALEREFPRIAARHDPRRFPRDALFDAMLVYVGAVLEATASTGR